jgi:integrase
MSKFSDRNRSCSDQCVKISLLETQSDAIQAGTIADWLQRFEFIKRQAVCLTTWKTDYFRPFSQLPSDAAISGDLLLKTIAKTTPNTRQRRRFCLAFRQLAEFVGIELDVRHLIGNYSATKVRPRNLPTDEDVMSGFEQIKNPHWQWVYGVVAAYGLRDHEAFYLDMSRFPIAQVREGKTGARQVWPLMPEWAEQWDLANIKRPPVTGDCHADYGARVTKFFARTALGFNAYDLRHAWAVRSIRFGLASPLAARQMGHSSLVHAQTYHLFINEREQQQAYDLLVAARKNQHFTGSFLRREINDVT